MNAWSVSFVSWRQTTSGRLSSSHGKSRGIRCFTELTFQVATRTFAMMAHGGFEGWALGHSWVLRPGFKLSVDDLCPVSGHRGHLLQDIVHRPAASETGVVSISLESERPEELAVLG